MNYHEKLLAYNKIAKIPPTFVKLLQNFYGTYVEAAKSNNTPADVYESILDKLLDLIFEQVKTPYAFEPYHQHLSAPFDYYQYGIDFIRPLVILEKSRILHRENLERITEQLKHGENVIFLANHQTELDPQVISLLLSQSDSQQKMAKEMIFVAGHRVISDPMAIPFSKGRNLLCIYSKKYISDHPEHREERTTHNQRTMIKMSELLSEGGKCIYVAPSGGRDRADALGNVTVAPFDAQSIEMFWLMAQRAERPTHFYPLALDTYHLLPPPEGIKKELGEARYTKATPVHLAFGNEIDMEHFPGSVGLGKRERRQVRAEYIWKQVNDDYTQLI